jgi:hypothetical protein
MRIVKLAERFAARIRTGIAKLVCPNAEGECRGTGNAAPTDIAERQLAVRKLRKYRGTLPAGFKFDREEIHERGSWIKDESRT